MFTPEDMEFLAPYAVEWSQLAPDVRVHIAMASILGKYGGMFYHISTYSLKQQIGLFKQFQSGELIFRGVRPSIKNQLSFENYFWGVPPIDKEKAGGKVNTLMKRYFEELANSLPQIAQGIHTPPLPYKAKYCLEKGTKIDFLKVAISRAPIPFFEGCQEHPTYQKIDL